MSQSGHAQFHASAMFVLLCLTIAFLLGCPDSSDNSPTAPTSAAPRWRQLSGPFTEEVMQDIWASGPNDVYGVTWEGSIFHYDGANWTCEYNNGGTRLNAITGSSPHDVWAAGVDGMLCHYDGSEWNQIDLHTEQSFWCIQAISPTDVYAGGGLSTLLHYDGSNWTPIELDDTYLVCGVHRSTSGDLYVIAAGYGGDKSRLLRRAGTEWQELFSTSMFLDGMYAASDSDIYFYGIDNGLWHCDGTTVTSVPLPSYGEVYDVATAGDGLLMIAFDWGHIMKWNGSSWDLMLQSPAIVYALWAFSEQQIHAAGRSVQYYYDGHDWTPGVVGSPTDKRLNGVWCADDGQAFAVGDSGIILRYDGAAWSRMTSPVTVRLNCVWGTSPTNLYAAGNDPNEPSATCVIIHYDGTSWSTDYSMIARALTCASGTSANDVYIAGYDSRYSPNVYHFDGSQWEQLVDYPYFGEIFGIWAGDSTSTYVVGDIFNSVFDGNEWQMITDTAFSGFKTDIDGVWPDFMVSSGNDYVSYFNGSHWIRAITDGVDMQGVWATAEGEAYAVGEYGYVLRLSHGTWVSEGRFNRVNLRAVHGSSEDNVFVVGDFGTILHLSR